MELATYYLLFLAISGVVFYVSWKISFSTKWAPWYLLFNLVVIFLFFNLQIHPFGILPPLFGQAKIGVLFYYHWVTWPLVASVIAGTYAIKEKRQNKAMIALAAMVIFFAALDLTQFFTHRDHQPLSNTFSADFSRQSDNYSCVPTSMTNLLKWYGYRVTEREMAELSLCHSGYSGGTNLAGVYYGLNQVAGDKYQVVVKGLTLDELITFKKPAMVTIVLGPLFYHSWLYVKYEKGMIYYLDPLAGDLESIRPEEFARSWRGDAIYLVEKGRY